MLNDIYIFMYVYIYMLRTIVSDTIVLCEEGCQSDEIDTGRLHCQTAVGVTGEVYR